MASVMARRWASMARCNVLDGLPVFQQQQQHAGTVPRMVGMQMMAVSSLAGSGFGSAQRNTSLPKIVRAKDTMFHLQQTRSLFIQTEDTPNPSSLKFLPGKVVLPEEFGTSMDFKKGDPTKNSPLAMLIMTIQGVEGVFLGADFITVSKQDSLSWDVLKPEVFAMIMDCYAADKSAVTGPLESGNQDEFAESGEDDSEIVALIKELLEERIRPMVHEDGGDIFFKGFDEDTGVVSVQLAGSCSGCPSSTVTLKQGVEHMLMHYIPEITAVHAMGELDNEETDGRTLKFHPQD